MGQGACPNCGANVFIVKDGVRICKYCNSAFVAEPAEAKHTVSEISLQSDIDRLLQKCREEPWNQMRYASLILDIDPTNREARALLIGR